MMFQLKTKSKTDKRQVMMMIGKNGGRFDSLNKIGESINSLEVGSDGGGSLDVRIRNRSKASQLDDDTRYEMSVSSV
ncbi:hypothetical protein CMK16_12270, partial [Candidatus Poribacteria bacterium]|nr:hypothetical protein [Candidatus Poribacteria bacterium]